jgi:hypothetical protein
MSSALSKTATRTRKEILSRKYLTAEGRLGSSDSVSSSIFRIFVISHSRLHRIGRALDPFICG